MFISCTYSFGARPRPPLPPPSPLPLVSVRTMAGLLDLPLIQFLGAMIELVLYGRSALLNTPVETAHAHV
jgi:hypothetical protein